MSQDLAPQGLKRWDRLLYRAFSREAPHLGEDWRVLVFRDKGFRRFFLKMQAQVYLLLIPWFGVSMLFLSATLTTVLLVSAVQLTAVTVFTLRARKHHLGVEVFKGGARAFKVERTAMVADPTQVLYRVGRFDHAVDAYETVARGQAFPTEHVGAVLDHLGAEPLESTLFTAELSDIFATPRR